MNRFVVPAAVAGFALIAGSAYGAPMFRTTSSQGSVHNLTLEALTFSGDITDGYGYRNSQFNGQANSEGAVIDQSQLMAGKVNIFLVDTSDQGLGFYIVFDDGVNQSGDSSGLVNNAGGQVFFSPDPEGDQLLYVEDDNNDTSLIREVSVDPFAFGFAWADGFTDGLAGTFDTAADSAVTFNITQFAGIDGFNLIGANGSISGLFGDAGGMFDGGLNDYVTLSIIPLPAPVAMGLAGLGLVGAVRRR